MNPRGKNTLLANSKHPFEDTNFMPQIKHQSKDSELNATDKNYRSNQFK